jgi:tryptophan synthase alpha chain
VPDLPLEEAEEVAAPPSVPASPSCRSSRRPRLPSARAHRRPGPRLPVHGVAHGHHGRARRPGRLVRRDRRPRPAATAVPVALGFGIATPEHAAQAAAAGADGVIVGSRLVRAAAEAGDAPTAVRELVAGLADALRR